MNSANSFPWPPEAIDMLRELRGAGMSCSQVAARLSAKFGHPLSRSAVIGKAHRLNIEGPSRIAVDAVAKIERARNAPPKKFLSSRERIMPDAVATRRVVDLIRAEKREAAPAPNHSNPDDLAASPCCLIDLRSSSCRWPMNVKAPDGQALFCNNDKLDSGSYCEGHAKRAFSRVINREQRADERRMLEQRRQEAHAAGLRDRVFGFGMAKRFA